MTVARYALPTSLSARVTGAVLSVAVAIIHIIDQGGIPGSKTPEYVGIGYWVLEIVAVLAAIVLLSGRPVGWFLCLGVAVGPLVGYILSRGPGLPDYSDDRGNWTEPLGVFSLVVEAALLILTAVILLRVSGGRTSSRTV